MLFRALPLDVGTDASHGHWLLDSAGCILAVVQGQGPRCATSAEAAALAGEPGLDRLGPRWHSNLCAEKLVLLEGRGGLPAVKWLYHAGGGGTHPA